MSANRKMNCFARRNTRRTYLLRGGGGRFGGGRCCAPVASIASDVALSIRKLRIDVARHHQHHARGFLLGVIVTGEIALHVAERTLNAERSAERTHRHDYLFSTFAGENFQIFWRRWRALLSFLLLGAKTDRDKQQHNR